MEYYINLVEQVKTGRLMAVEALDRGEDRIERFAARGWDVKKEEYWFESILLSFCFGELPL